MNTDATRVPLAPQPAIRRLLAAVTLAAAGAVSLPAAAGPGMGMPGAGAMRMLEQVGASAEQRSQIEQIMQTAQTELRSQHDQDRLLRSQLRQQFAQPAVDEAAVEALRQQMLALHDARSQRMTQAMLEASRVLSAEQRQKLAALMEQGGERGPGRDPERRGGRG